MHHRVLSAFASNCISYEIVVFWHLLLDKDGRNITQNRFRWWCHNEETLPAVWALCERNPVDTPHKGSVMQTLWCILCCFTGYSTEQTVQLPVIWGHVAFFPWRMFAKTKGCIYRESFHSVSERIWIPTNYFSVFLLFKAPRDVARCFRPLDPFTNMV